MTRFAKIAGATLFVAAVLAAAMIWFRTYNMFQLNQAVVNGNQILSREQILSLASLDYSQEIFYIDMNLIKSRICRHPLVRNASIHRFLPSGISIHVQERDLIAAITGENIQAVDVEGVVIPADNMLAMYDLPVITGVTTVRDTTHGFVASEQMMTLINLLYAIREVDFELYNELSEAHFSKDTGVVFYMRATDLPVILGFDDYAHKALYFSTMYHYLKNHGELASLKAIDVRFSDQVVVKI
ncbi:FtsQ-type POTRA domain-containing protein [candidate division KSB1 bacterium]|nr:FtsQ-type POTRA domain-containing protein [candidate division KSB1 bacterium]